MCIFNGSTTASPILFGIYGTTNVQEAARISTSRNFLIGTSVDLGNRLEVLGNSSVSAVSKIRTIFSGFGTTGNPFYDDALNLGESSVQSKIQVGNSAANDYGTFLRFQVNTAATPSTPVTALTISPSGAATFSNSVNGTIFDASSQYRINGNNILAVPTVIGQNVVKINSAGYYGVQLVGANDTGIFIGNTGNLLINTLTDAGQKLQVNGAVTFNNSTASDEHAYYWQRTGGSPSNLWSWSANAATAYMRNHTTTNVVVTILNNGNFGINNTTPGSKLSVVGLPTSAAGLSAGDIWNNGGVLNIV
jgi:hypothetical protein